MARAPPRLHNRPRLTLQWYLLRQLVVAFLIALAGTSFVVVPAVLVSAIHKLGGVELFALLGYVPMLAMNLVSFALPLCFLLAVVATFGRLAQDQEWTAMQMAGIHPFKALLPGLLCACALSAGTYWMLANHEPRSTWEQREYLRDALANAFRRLAPGRTELQFGDFYLNSAGRDGPSFVQAVVQIPARKEGERIVIVADRVDPWFEGNDLVLRAIRARAVAGKANPRTDQWVLRVPLSDAYQPRPLNKLQARYLTSAQMTELLETETVEPDRARKYELEIQRRRALAAVFPMFLLLGAPTGLWLRRGTLLAALATAVGYAFAYYVLFIRASKELALHGAVPVPVAAWAVNVLGLLAGMWMCWRVLRR
ncbi:MAG: YjgP/YjgQ family permease [Planctomycetes bacterium]|nr:YjgP/YjgQ family permease [Planctomycetota bacterium]